MSKIFTSGFASILDDLGCDGYSIDADRVLASLNNGDPLEDAKEAEIITSQYYRFTGAIGSMRSHKGKRFPTGGYIEVLFDTVAAKSTPACSSYEHFWYERWVNAHVNLVLNRIYGTNRPEIDNFLLLNDGALEHIITLIFGGKETIDAEQAYSVAMMVASRNKGDKLTEVETNLIRARFFKLSRDELQQIKDTLIREIRAEWEMFSNLSTEEILGEEMLA